MPVRLDPRPLKHEGQKKFYLKYVNPGIGGYAPGELTILYGPVPSEDILGYYYDVYGRWLNDDGGLDSCALGKKDLAKLAEKGVEPTPIEQWETAKELVLAAYPHLKEEVA